MVNLQKSMENIPHASDRMRCLHRHEKVIDVAENTIGRCVLIMMFETHAEHIEENTEHDEDVELLIGSQIKEESGNGELESQTMAKEKAFSRPVHYSWPR
jgi:hypothetical protein